MGKKICGLLLSFVILWCSSACTANESAVEVTKTPVVATASDRASSLAAMDYCNDKGYDIEKLYSLTDCAVAVENGKYEYLVCDEYEEVELRSFALKYVEDCSYKSLYSLCFSADSFDLCQQFNLSIKELTNNGTIDKICNSYKGDAKYKNAKTAGNPLYIMYLDGVEGFSVMNDDGEAEGLEIDIVVALCNNLGYTPVFVDGEYDEGFDLLVNGEVDLIMSVDSIKSILGDDFILSDPYFTVNYKVYETAS